MRRVVSLFVLAVLAALFNVVAPPSATAAAPIVGQVVQYGGTPIPGTTVNLHVDDAGEPRAEVAVSDVTDSNGEFSLTPPAPDEVYWVEVVRNSRVQGGYVRDRDTGPSYVEFDVANAAPVPPGTRLGRVLVAHSYISGVVVNAANGARLRGIDVSARDVVDRTDVIGSDRTNRDGYFRIPAYGEEFALRVFGDARGFENGWVACDKGVLPTWGEACSVGTGRIGRIRLDRL